MMLRIFALFPLTPAVAQGIALTSLAPPATKSLALGDPDEDTPTGRSAAILGSLVSLILMVVLLKTGWRFWR